LAAEELAVFADGDKHKPCRHRRGKGGGEVKRRPSNDLTDFLNIAEAPDWVWEEYQRLRDKLVATEAERDANNRHLVARTNELETLKTAHMYLVDELKTVKAELNSERMLRAYQSAERDELQRYKEYHEWAEGQIAAVTKKPITTLGALAKEFSALEAERDEFKYAVIEIFSQTGGNNPSHIGQDRAFAVARNVLRKFDNKAETIDAAKGGAK
jgi:hypothetical protein